MKIGTNEVISVFILYVLMSNYAENINEFLVKLNVFFPSLAAYSGMKFYCNMQFMPILNKGVLESIDLICAVVMIVLVICMILKLLSISKILVILCVMWLVLLILLLSNIDSFVVACIGIMISKVLLNSLVVSIMLYLSSVMFRVFNYLKNKCN